ncbi:hypothetical protein vseg_007083 [Gypsophila vaccaria]
MKSVIERYNKMKEDSHEMSSAASELKFWQREATSLRQQLQYLQESHRRLMGEELSGLTIKDLQNLGEQLETSLKTARMRKEQLLSDEIKELNRRATLIHQDNIELYKQVDIMQQQNLELHKKVNTQDVNQTEQHPYMSYNVKNSRHKHGPTNLQLSPPEQQTNEKATKALKLGYSTLSILSFIDCTNGIQSTALT